MIDNPFAALLDGVPRFYAEETCWLLEADVLAALAAAVPDDLAEAGKVLEGVTPGSWIANGASVNTKPDESAVAVCVSMGTRSREEAEANARFIAWCREGVPALLARITAQEATIKGLEAKARESAMQELASLGQAQEAYEAQVAAETALAAMTKERDEAVAERDRVSAINVKHCEAVNTLLVDGARLETALAASQARVAKLVEAGKDAIVAMQEARATIASKREHGLLTNSVHALRAAITEASQ